MATAPDLPLFFNDLIPLSSVDHSNYKLRRQNSAPFLKNQHAVPVTVDEFINAGRFMPIIFSTGPSPVPLALMGLNEGVNMTINDDGVAEGETYIPAYIRRYPFMLARLRTEKDELSLCFDPTAPHVGPSDDGDALFDGDQPSAVTQEVLQFCTQFEEAGFRTQQFIEELTKLDLLMDGEVQIQMDGQEQPFIYRGFQMVNEEKLRDLRGDALRKIAQNGMLPLIYAHLFSLNLVRELFAKQYQAGKVPGMVAAPAEPAV